MEKLTSEQKEYYLSEADKHATFLAEKVWKPAFVMAFVHGIRHGREDATAEMNAKLALHCKKADLKDELNEALNRNHPLRQRNKKK